MEAVEKKRYIGVLASWTLSSHVHMCLAGHTAKPQNAAKRGKCKQVDRRRENGKQKNMAARCRLTAGAQFVFIYLLDETRQTDRRNRICKDF
jgi:hypothetical protein